MLAAWMLLIVSLMVTASIVQLQDDIIAEADPTAPIIVYQQRDRRISITQSTIPTRGSFTQRRLLQTDDLMSMKPMTIILLIVVSGVIGISLITATVVGCFCMCKSLRNKYRNLVMEEREREEKFLASLAPWHVTDGRPLDEVLIDSRGRQHFFLRVQGSTRENPRDTVIRIADGLINLDYSLPQNAATRGNRLIIVPSDSDSQTSNPDCPTSNPDCPTSNPDCPTSNPDCPTGNPDCPTSNPDCPTSNPDCPTGNPDCPTSNPNPSGEVIVTEATIEDATDPAIINSDDQNIVPSQSDEDMDMIDVRFGKDCPIIKVTIPSDDSSADSSRNASASNSPVHSELGTVRRRSANKDSPLHNSLSMAMKRKSPSHTGSIDDGPSSVNQCTSNSSVHSTVTARDIAVCKREHVVIPPEIEEIEECVKDV